MTERPAEPKLAAKILAIVVTYLPKRDTLRTLVSIYAEQSATVLVVDNSPAEDDSTWSHLVDLCEKRCNVRMVRCGTNLGIAAAFNIGIEVVLREGFDYALLSDQDSEPEPGMLSGLHQTYSALTKQGIKVGCVAPAYFDRKTMQLFSFQVDAPGKFFYQNADGGGAIPWLEVITAISSGALIARPALTDVGPMCEKFFIDHVDTEWCHRARQFGFRLFGTSSARLNHQLGDNLLRVWLFGWHKCNEYSSTRLYYRFRNFMLLCKLPYISTRWKVRASLYWILSFYGHVLFSTSRRRNLRMILYGLWHGLRGRGGPMG